MRIINEPENEGQFIEFAEWPRRLYAGHVRRIFTLCVGITPRTWHFGVEIDLAESSFHAYLLALGPLYLSLTSQQ